MKLAALCLVAAAALAAAASTRGQQPSKTAVNAAGVVSAPAGSAVNAQLQKSEAVASEDGADIDSHMHSHGHAFKSGKGCGHSVPHFSAALREMQEAAPNSPPESVVDVHGRRTQTTFKPAAQAVVDGDGGPIRIAVSLGVVIIVFTATLTVALRPSVHRTASLGFSA